MATLGKKDMGRIGGCGGRITVRDTLGAQMTSLLLLRACVGLCVGCVRRVDEEEEHEEEEDEEE